MLEKSSPSPTIPTSTKSPSITAFFNSETFETLTLIFPLKTFGASSVPLKSLESTSLLLLFPSYTT